MKLILVRHGETLSNRENRVQGITDVPLSDVGRKQAEQLAMSLQNEKIDAIYSSPLRRAYHTASIIASYHGLPIEIDVNFQEMNHGDFENKTIQELKETHLPFITRWFEDPSSVVMPHGESLFEVQTRAWYSIQKILETRQAALIVSHSITIMAILCKITNRGLSRGRELRADLASKTVVEFTDGGGVITTFNDTSHLKETGAPIDLVLVL